MGIKVGIIFNSWWSTRLKGELIIFFLAINTKLDDF